MVYGCLFFYVALAALNSQCIVGIFFDFFLS